MTERQNTEEEENHRYVKKKIKIHIAHVLADISIAL